MADKQRIVRQWLETEEAFGIADVPLGRKRSAARASAKAAQKPAAAAGDVEAAVAAMRAGPRPAAAPQKPAAAPQRPAAAPQKPAASSPPEVHFAARRHPPQQEALIPGAAPRAPSAAKSKVAAPPPPPGDVHALAPITKRQKIDALDALRKEVEHSCSPHLNDIATRVVFGEGNPDAELMFIGEGPGIEEDRTGRPFVGRSGQLLDKMITAIGYKREDVYIANVVKLRCADWDAGHTRLTDRPPNPEEVARGLPILHRQIEIIRPKVIVTLGAPAVKHLTGATEGVMKLRGNWLQYRGIPVMPTYHPSFVLRAYTEENRRKVWSDLKAAVSKIQEG